MSEEVAASPTHLPEVGNTEATTQNEEEPLDPRVGPELERLNAAAESVNYLETELTQGKIAINKYMQDMVAQLKDAAETVGTSRIEQAREYYDSLSQSEFLKQQLCEASAAYKLSVSKCEVAKEMLRIAEQGFLERANAAEGNAAHIDFTYQEMLNHATETVVRAENERADCDRLVRELTSRTAEIEIKLNLIRRQHPRSIERTARYFELRQRTDAELKERRRRCEEVAALLRRAKASYRRSMRRLDKISNEIHQRRVGCVVPAASAEDDEEEEEEEIDQNVPRNSAAKINNNSTVDGPAASVESSMAALPGHTRTGTVSASPSMPNRSNETSKRPSILESAMQSARNMVESATRTRKSVSIMPTGASLSQSHNGTTANSSTNVDDRNARSLSQLSFLGSVGDKTEEFPVDFGGRQADQSAEPDTFRSEIERARWRRMGDSGSVSKPADSPIRAFRAQSISNSVTDTIDSQSESSSVASFLLDVAFEKLALNDVGDRPRTLATDSLSSVSRTSATTVESPLSNEPSQSEVECDTVTPRPSAIERVSFTAQPVAEAQEDRSRANSSDTETVAVEKAQGPGTDSDAESDFEAIETAL